MPIPMVIGALGALGGLFGRAGGGAAKERAGVNQFNQNQDALRTSQYGTQQQSILQLLGLLERGTQDRAQMGLNAPGQRARQAVLGSLMQNMQPTRIQAPPGIRMGNISGGFNASNLLNPEARQAGGELSRQALQALLTRSDVPVMLDTSQSILTPPTPSPYQRAGKGESILSILGLIGSGLTGAGMGAAFGNNPNAFRTPPFNPRGFGG